MNKALFLDRDGILLQLHYDPEEGTIRTIFRPDQLVFMPGIVQVLRAARRLGFKIIIISNQPDIGLQKIRSGRFQQIDTKIRHMVDGAYYCFHHPFARLSLYRRRCGCRKPKPGLILTAVREHQIDVSRSFMLGDGVNDVKAGAAAGCKTILLTNPLESEYLRILQDRLDGARPDFLVKKLTEVVPILSSV